MKLIVVNVSEKELEHLAKALAEAAKFAPQILDEVFPKRKAK